MVVGLRNRVALSFGTLALGLSALLAVLAWTLVTQSVLRQTSQTALVEAALDRADVQGALDAGSTDVPGVLESLPGSDAVAEMALVAGSGTAPGRRWGRRACPPDWCTWSPAGRRRPSDCSWTAGCTSPWDCRCARTGTPTSSCTPWPRWPGEPEACRSASPVPRW